MYNIECGYRYLYVNHNYLFYRIEAEKISLLKCSMKEKILCISCSGFQRFRRSQLITGRMKIKRRNKGLHIASSSSSLFFFFFLRFSVGNDYVVVPRKLFWIYNRFVNLICGGNYIIGSYGFEEIRRPESPGNRNTPNLRICCGLKIHIRIADIYDFIFGDI